ncbi:MAG TPA: BTAD domain-containing putative transcriptional regulator [Longimicrobium sp.]|nr:BTAD domain-containing putative transcriptional regulator [Longimicrobium sp.]
MQSKRNMLRIHTFGALAVRSGDRAMAGAAAQPRRLAVLAVLARAGTRGVTRDKLLALLWPDSPEEPARRALAQALYALRRDLGSDEAFLGTRDVRLNPDVIASDVGDFEAALAEGDPERAVGLYAGPFLDGFRVPGLDEFDRWIETERAALALRFGEALETLAGRAAAAGDHAGAVAWWRRLAGADPLSARVAVRLMRALDAAGDRAGALQHARIHESLVDAHLGMPPSPEVTALAERLRSEPEPARPAPAVVTAPVPVPAATPAETPEPALAAASVPGEVQAVASAAGRSTDLADASPVDGDGVSLPYPAAVVKSTEEDVIAIFPAEADRRESSAPARRTTWMRRGAKAVAAVLTLGLIAWHAMRPRGEHGHPLLAVGRVASYTGDAPGTAAPLADLLATGLARSRGVRVVSRATVFERLRGGPDSTGAGLAAAARAAGATQLVEGDVYPLGGGRLRLDLRRVDLGSGAVIAAYRLEGSDPVALADSGAARIAGDLPGTEGRPAGLTTTSPLAARLYERGLSAWAQGDAVGAARLFDEALAEDTAFAMAAWYSAQTHLDSTHERRVQHALRLARTASDRERLIIRAGYASATSSPTLRALGDTLSMRYPREPAGPFYTGMALLAADRPLEAIPQFKRVMEQDPRGLDGSGPGCMACNAMRQLISAYQIADSLRAAEREVRRWTQLQPRSAAAWKTLHDVLEITEGGDESMAAFRTASTLDPSLNSISILVLAQHLIRRGEYARADRLLREQVQAGDEERTVDSWWYQALSLRQQGRMKEALAAARQSRAASRSVPTSPGAAPGVALMEAQILFEMGRYRESAALFDSISRLRWPGAQPSALARHRAWTLAHKANALAAMRDTAGVAALIDTVRTLGAQSFLARDHKLYHHVAGLLHRERGDLPRAAASFRAAMTSPTTGYTRTNVSLAAVLLRLNRPHEAVALLQPALRGSLESSNLYANRMDVHQLLGRAWAAAGRADSAAVHFGIVNAARTQADPGLPDAAR